MGAWSGFFEPINSNGCLAGGFLRFFWCFLTILTVLVDLGGEKVDFTLLEMRGEKEAVFNRSLAIDFVGFWCF